MENLKKRLTESKKAARIVGYVDLTFSTLIACAIGQQIIQNYEAIGFYVLLLHLVGRISLSILLIESTTKKKSEDAIWRAEMWLGSLTAHLFLFWFWLGIRFLLAMISSNHSLSGSAGSGLLVVGGVTFVTVVYSIFYMMVNAFDKELRDGTQGLNMRQYVAGVASFLLLIFSAISISIHLQ